MAWIQNVSMYDIQCGLESRYIFNSTLIQIVDPDMDYPQPHDQFKEIYQFKFLDIEEDGIVYNNDGTYINMNRFAITDDQAKELVYILNTNLENNKNVIVHCVAGVRRSGAVCEVGTIMGFEDIRTYRDPNLLVKNKMIKYLNSKKKYA